MIKEKWNIKGWLFKALAAVFIVVILLLITSLFLNSPETGKAFISFVDRSFWVFTALRWSVYAVVIFYWPTLSVMMTKRFSGTAVDYDQVLIKRWFIVRVLTVYELLFPFSIVTQIGQWL